MSSSRLEQNHGSYRELEIENEKLKKEVKIKNKEINILNTRILQLQEKYLEIASRNGTKEKKLEDQ